MINKSKLSCVSYFTKNIIIIIMRIWIRREKIITLINKKEINKMITTLIKKIKGFFETKCKPNLKNETIEKMLVETKKNLLKINIFKIEDNVKLYLIMKK